MRIMIALVVLFCSAVLTSAMAAEKPDHLLVVMVKSKDGKTHLGEQMTSARNCQIVAETFAKAQAEKAPFTITLSSDPKVAGEVVAAACITPSGDTNLLTQFTPDTPLSVEDIDSFFESVRQGVDKMTKKP